MRNEARNKIKNRILKSFLDHVMQIEPYPIVILMKDPTGGFLENKVELSKTGSRKACFSQSGAGWD